MLDGAIQKEKDKGGSIKRAHGQEEGGTMIGTKLKEMTQYIVLVGERLAMHILEFTCLAVYSLYQPWKTSQFP